MVFGPQLMSTVSCLKGSVLTSRRSSFGVRVTAAVSGPKKCTTFKTVRRQELKNAPRTLSSASAGGYSGSSSSVRDKLMRAGARSSMDFPMVSAQKGWMSAARVEMKLSLFLRRSSCGESLLSASIQAILPRLPVPRYPSSTSSGRRCNLPASASSFIAAKDFSTFSFFSQTLITQKPFSKRQAANSSASTSSCSLGPTRRSKLSSFPPKPGRFRPSGTFRLSGLY
mmetsp:Transcript_100716/g.267704  ORF Transcript_100716/g.267704 Transcript_100716/m.267704 type:complete len:226 (-) Transcript_100716:219-896(-)